MQDEASDVLMAFRSGRDEAFDAAFETLFRLHQRAVYGWVLRIVRNTAVAEELTVETFWRVYQAHARFDPQKGFEGWARTIATRLALDWMRRQHAEAELATDLAAPSSGDAGVAEEIRRKTTQAFSRLPPKLRIVAVMVVVEEMQHKEAAAALGISVAAVKMRVFRALRLLRTDLERQGIRP